MKEAGETAGGAVNCIWSRALCNAESCVRIEQRGGTYRAEAYQSREQRAESREQRAESREQRAENREMIYYTAVGQLRMLGSIRETPFLSGGCIMFEAPREVRERWWNARFTS